MVLEVQQKSYVDIILNIDLGKIERQSLALKVKCTINGNVFHEYVTYSIGDDERVKRILLEPGQMLKAELFLHEKGLKSLTPVTGNFDVARQSSIKVGESVSANIFTDGLWSETQLPLFRVIKEDATAKTLQLQFNFNEQYEFDKLYWKLKVISPVDGILLFDKSVDVNKVSIVTKNPKTAKIELPDIPIQSEGTYYIQLQHNMETAFVNGVESVDYELMDR